MLNDRQEELKTLERDITTLEAINAAVPAAALRRCGQDAAGRPRKGEFENNFEWGGDFGAPDETYLSKQFGKPVFVHHFPTAIKGFYFEVDKDRPECALGIDLLAPEGYGEIIGGGERAASLEYLEKQLKHHDLPQETFEWYLDLRRYGSVPHAGFGMGIERYRRLDVPASNMSARPFRFRGLYRLKP